MASSYYIYYRVRQDSAEAARATLLGMMTRIEALTAVQGRWLCKAEERLLWMEIYENVQDEAAFQDTLDNELKASQFARYLQPGAVRRVERFVACA